MFTFNPDNKLMLAIAAFGDMMWLTILWGVCCLPVITAGASTAAYMAALMAMAEERGGGVTRGFFRRLRENFRQATAMWLVMLLAGAVLALDLWACRAVREPAALMYLLRCTTLLFVLAYFALLVWLFAGVGRFYASVGQSFQNAACWAAVHWRTTLCLLALGAASAVCVWLLEVLAVAPVSLLSFCQARLLARVFRRYERPAGESGAAG